MQNTPPKRENNIISMAQKKGENKPFLPQFYTTFRTIHEHIFYIVFGNLYRFHICQNFEQHFSGSRDFVQNVKHVFQPQTAADADRFRLTT